MAPIRARRTTRDVPTTSTLRQVQETECGVVALAVVLAHHGAWIPLPELRRKCDVSRHGVNAMMLIQAAKSYGLTVRALRVGVDDLGHLASPAIILWNQHHFLVLEGIDGDTAYLNDPATGRRKVDLATLRDGYSNVTLTMRPGDEFEQRGTPPQTRSLLVDHLRPGRWLILLLGLIVLIETSLLPIMVAIFGRTVDGRGGSWLPLALVAGLLLAARGLHVGIIDLAIERVARPAIQRVADDMAHVPPAFLELRQTDELSGRLRLAETPVTAVVLAMVSGIRLCLGLPLWVGVLAWIDPRVAIALIVAFALALVLQRWSSTSGNPAGTEPFNHRLREVLLEADIWRQRKRIQANDEQSAILSHAVCASSEDIRSKNDREYGVVAINAWRWSTAPMVVLLPAVVAGVLGATGAVTTGEIVVTLLAAWYCSTLISMQASIGRSLSTLPTSIAQLRDSTEEREYSRQRITATEQAA